MNCNRKGCFRKNETHKCFLCNDKFSPASNPTCPECNFKKCDNGHCGCNLPKETREVVDKFYDLFCEPHGYSNLTHKTLKVLLETYLQNCLTNINPKNLVIWIEENACVQWNPIRTPALGWNTLTLLEALCDSSKTSLSIGNEERSKAQLNKMLKILRQKIKNAKKKFRPLIQRCEYRETPRTRCNKTPIHKISHGMHLCKYHYKKIQEKEKETKSQKTLEEFQA